VAPADTKIFVTLSITMPYSKAEFDLAKQEKYKDAVASAAGTVAANVDILSVTEGQRRGGSINIETKLRAADEAGMAKISESLGSGDAVKTKVNTELKKQGLSEATASSSPKISSPESSSASGSKGESSNAGGIVGGTLGVLVVVALSGLAFCLWRKTKISKVAPTQGDIDPENATVGTTLNDERQGQRERESLRPPASVESTEEVGAESHDIESASDCIQDGRTLHEESPGVEIQQTCNTEHNILKPTGESNEIASISSLPGIERARSN
jgi:hypothetical protein